MSTKISPTTGFWATVGKIGALVAVLWGGLQIYNFFFAKEPSLEVSAECSRFSLPDSFYAELDKLSTNPTVLDIMNLLPEKSGNQVETAQHILDLMKKDKDFYLGSKIQRWESQCRFVVNNKGGKEAQALKLEARMMGTYSLDRPGEQKKTDKFENAISLGNLHPGSHLSLTIWNESFFFIDDRRAAHVSYTEGIVPIDFSSHSLSDYFSDRPFSFGAFLFVLIYIAIAGGIAIGRWSKKIRIIKPSSTESTEEVVAIEED